MTIKFSHEKFTHSNHILRHPNIYWQEHNFKKHYKQKPTNIHNYLHYRSSQTKHLKDSPPYSQAVTLRIIYRDENELKRQNNKLKQQFSPWGYPNMLNKNQTIKAIPTPRQDALKLRPTLKMNCILPIKFKNTFPPSKRNVKGTKHFFNGHKWVLIYAWPPDYKMILC